MESHSAEVSMPGPRLPDVLKEIADHLIRDNWCRFSTADGKRAYYIVGCDEQESEMAGKAGFSHCQHPTPTPTETPSEWATRPQVADKEIRLDADEQCEADISREKICLRELVGKYKKLIPRWEQLERLAFDDQSMEEASKAFLFGFYRACIALCAANVEAQVKRLCGPDQGQGAMDMIDSVERHGHLGRDSAKHARDLCRARIRILHDANAPTADKAKEMLVVARLLVTELRKRA
jgi:hypothetical protein